MANRLSKSHSPYLKQHENNPVNWQPWDEDTLNQARRENKLMVVSIGYSTCHWCHVMERESFEDERVASVMNKHFISVKVDREENPEIDQIYMTAVQLMKGQGGWPLNCICLPDGRPIYGGTYFPKEEWISTLIQLHEYWLNKPDLAKEFADKLEKGIINTEKIPVIVQNSTFKKEEIKEFVPKWKASFDQTWGGLGHAPKFPMPNDLQFWIEHAFFTQDLEIQTHLIKSLRFMASGGIYDHVGGGFSRYAVDEKWHIPHFEKMLYDNAQLVTVYAKAFRDHPLPLYKRVVQETLNWCIEDLKSENGGYFCALDADSEGVEGKFYTFQKEEFEHLLGEDANLFSEHFNLKEEGNWEEENTNVLYTLSDSDEIALEAGYTLQEWEETLRSAKNKLKTYRNQRIRPSLDYKQLNSWNCLLLKAYVEAYKTFENEDYQKEALSIQKFIETHLEKQDGSLLRQPALNGKEITGVLEDYAHYIQALIQLYEITSEESFLWKALGYTEYVIEHFLDEDETFFHFTHINSPVLITRKLEVLDNVIPSSNSVMMKNLLTLNKIFDKPIFKEIVYRAMRSILPELKKYPSSYSNWASLFQEIVHGSQEIVLSGNNSSEWKSEVFKTNYPYNLVFSGSKPSEIPLLSNRLSSENRAFVCKNNSCSLPLESKEELLHLLAKDDLKSY